MLLKLLKFKIAWRPQGHPLFTYLTNPPYAINFSSLLSCPPLCDALITVPIILISCARLLFHGDALLTLLGLWLPVPQGGGDLLSCLAKKLLVLLIFRRYQLHALGCHALPSPHSEVWMSTSLRSGLI